MKIYAATVAAIAVASGLANAQQVVDRSVHRALREAETVDIIVTMKSTDNVLESFQESAYRSRSERIQALRSKLQASSAKALEPLASFVAKESAAQPLEVETVWIAPYAFVKAASAETVAKLAALPNVESIREDTPIVLEQPVIDPRPIEAIQGTEWGVSRIGAPKVWADGTAGQGIVVGVIDSGVRHTHEALRRNFLGKYGWFDPESKSPEPYDVSGHGSHCAGTIAGAKGIGVAPAATWMACKGCRSKGCPRVDLMKCAQFMLCPTDTDGNNEDCSKAPRIVSNSWGGGQGDFWYKPAVDAWIKAGIVPVFAQGNAGPECGTANSPGDYPNVIGVGSLNPTEELRRTSSKGPTVFGRIKPDITAPGGLIRSAYNRSDTDYNTISGTSMAAPHVSGSIALLLSQNPELTLDEIKVLLYTTTDQKLPPSNYTCGVTSDLTWPNNQYGHGRLNIFHAYQGFRPGPSPTTVPTTQPPAPTTQAPKPTTTSPSTPVPTTPAPTTQTPTSKPTPPACATPSGGQCGSEEHGAACCPEGEYCQPWNPWFYQCRPAPKQCGAVEVGIDYNGQDIKTIKGGFAWDCCDACAQTPGCKAFTFVNYNGDGQSACYLKSGSSHKRKLVGAVSAAVVNPLPKCSQIANTDFVGEDLKRVDAEDASECCDKCSSTTGCKAFTFVNNDWDKKSCYLKKKAGTKSPYSGVISGVVN
ncbi:hypothetical protein ATCC90586_012118 [Pythium insidiosum]|nr:hypothetical protein ATCC90586_012118 [Pythium insidiosum]